MFSAGTYYIGDLCYVLYEKQWLEICEAISLIGEEEFKKQAWVIMVENKMPIGIAQTLFGDGSYVVEYDNQQKTIPVDSGTIGCIRLDCVKDIVQAKECGAIVEFKESFDISYEDGIIRFGDVWINTEDTEIEYEC